jgi:hypothetical protein
MICSPSFSGEYAIAVIDKSDDPKCPNYILQYSKASREIGLPPPPPPPPGIRAERVKKFDPKKDVKFQTVELPIEIASLLIPAWRRSVMATRYQGDKAWHGGLDGVSYFFYADRWFYGMSWCPETGISKSLVELGGLLAELVQASPSTRPAIEQQVINACRGLQMKLGVAP